MWNAVVRKEILAYNLISSKAIDTTNSNQDQIPTTNTPSQDLRSQTQQVKSKKKGFCYLCMHKYICIHTCIYVYI